MPLEALGVFCLVKPPQVTNKFPKLPCVTLFRPSLFSCLGPIWPRALAGLHRMLLSSLACRLMRPERHLNTKLGFPQALRTSRFEEGLLPPASNRVRAKCPNQPSYSAVAGGIIDALRHPTFREHAVLGLPRIRVVKTCSLSSSGYAVALWPRQPRFDSWWGQL